MRIIAGKFRGRVLKSPGEAQTRPTSDRLRETLFNILAPRIEGARFLDLCAGTGAVGIEALSRGASFVTFVDQSKRMCALIADNSEALELKRADFQIVTADALEFQRRHLKKGGPPFDLIFFDPPYADDYEGVLSYLGEQQNLLASDAIVIVEHFKKNVLAEDFGQLSKYRIVKQGDSTLSFFKSAPALVIEPE